MILAFPLTRTIENPEDSEPEEMLRAAPPMVADSESDLGAGEFLIYEGAKGGITEHDLAGGLSKGFTFDRRIRRTTSEGKTTTRKL